MRGLLETIRLRDGQPLELPLHQGRLSASWNAFFRGEPPELARCLAGTLASPLPADCLLRLAFEQGPSDAPRCSVSVRDPAFYSSLGLGGTLGAAESFVRGEWETDHPTALIRMLLRNRELLGGLDPRLARLAEPGRRLAHWLRRTNAATFSTSIERPSPSSIESSASAGCAPIGARRPRRAAAIARTRGRSSVRAITK